MPSNNSTQVSFLAGIGDGRFSTPKTQAFPYLSSHAASQVIAGDFNRDGKKDIAVFPGRDSPIQIYLGNNDGTFSAAPSLTLPDPDLAQMGTPDFNGDGIPDLIAWGANAIYVCLGKGDGTFGQPVFSTAATSPNVGWGDFTGDGKPDIVMSNSGSNTLVLLAGKGDGTFAASSPIPLAGQAAGSSFNRPLPNAISVADFDRDGRLDIAILLGPLLTPAGQSQYLTEVLSGAGDGSFPVAHFTTGLFYGATPVDMNRDGIPDLVGFRDTFPEMQKSEGSGVSVRLGNGDGTFQPDVIVTAVGIFSVGDLNRDGLPDLAIADSRGVAAFLNLSRFLPLTIVSAAGFTPGPLAADAFAAAFGTGLTRTSGAPAVLVQDSAGVTRSAEVYFASSTQINFRVPPETATGSATVIVAASPLGAQVTAQVQIAAVAPSLFTVGANIAAAYAVKVTAGTATTVPVFSASAEGVSAIPLSVSQGSTYLVMYGTGFDAATLSHTTASIQGIPGMVTFAGPQPGIPGLDQINVLLPPVLAGTGSAKVSITVNGVTSNLVQIVIQ